MRLYWILQRASLRGALHYRMNLLVMVVTGAIYQGSGFAFVWVVLHRFPSLAGWSFAQVAFLYGLRLLAHALWLLPFNALLTFDWLVREGEFDRYLLRPLNPLVQLMTTRTMRMGSAGDLVAGIAIFAVAARAAGVDWSPLAIGFCVLAIAGGALIEAAVQLGLAGLTFRLLDTYNLREAVDDLFSTFGSYPLKIFGAGTEWLLTFVVPVAFAAYLPASTLLGTGDLRVAPWLGYAGPALGLGLFVLAYRFWRGQLRYYQSAGH